AITVNDRRKAKQDRLRCPQRNSFRLPVSYFRSAGEIFLDNATSRCRYETLAGSLSQLSLTALSRVRKSPPEVDQGGGYCLRPRLEEHPVFYSLRRHEPCLCQVLHVACHRRLTGADLPDDGTQANAVFDEISINLLREVSDRIKQPLNDHEPLLVRQSL